MYTTMELPWQALSITQQKILTLPIRRYWYPDWGWGYMYQQALIRKPIVDYPDWEILLSLLKPYSPNEDTCTNRPSSGNQLLTLPIGRYWYPYWNPILPMRIQVPTGPHQETNCWLSRLGDTVILIETLFSQWGYMYQHALIRKPIVDYPDWEILLSWLKPYSPNEDTCTNRPSSGNQLLTIPIGRYCYPYWNPILPMRIHVLYQQALIRKPIVDSPYWNPILPIRMSSWPQRGKHWFVNNYVSAIKQD